MASGIAEHVPAPGVFVKASKSTSEWYEHLKPRGSCLRLHSLLEKQPELIHQLGPKGITVLHKGVQHGCVLLVRSILVNMFDDKGYCKCGVCGRGDSRLTRGQLLRKAWEDDITAVQMAVVSGSPKMVLLLKWALDKNELEVKQKNLSSKDDQVTFSDASRVRIRRVQHRSTGNALWFSGDEGDMEGEDTSSVSEVGNIENCDLSTPMELGPGDAEEEIMEVAVPENVNDTESISLVVPDVKDDTIDHVYRIGSEESVMIPKVYDLIEHLLEDLDIQEDIRMWKDKCTKDVDFEFVPVAHVILHFLFSTVGTDAEINKLFKFFKSIIRACNEHDLKEQGNLEGSGAIEDVGSIKGNNYFERSGTMVATLFKILDSRGRTILHAALDANVCKSGTWDTFDQMEKLGPKILPTELKKKYLNSKDGGGRTILHAMCTNPRPIPMNVLNILDCNANLDPLCHEELATLQKWCFPLYRKRCSYKPIHLAILFDSIDEFGHIYFSSKPRDSVFETFEVFDFSIESTMIANAVSVANRFEPIQLAAFLGRATIIEEILKKPKIKLIHDKGTNSSEYSSWSYPAIHCAALSGQVETIQSILEFSIYDPFVQHYFEGTALHLLLKRKNFNPYVKMFQTLALFHVLPNSKQYARLKDEFSKLHYNEHELEMFSANEISCINLLLQAGIDIWTPHFNTGERPSPGSMANDEARKWWYNKVVTEVVTQKTSINSASNATSVIATLVATASFIGPLQPPLGLTDDGFLHTSISAVRVYFMCNGLSFYFSIASILMAVLPTIPMPKESLYDELFRSQRCLKTAALLLLVAIICILTSFTSASIAVVSSERHDKQLVYGYVGVGGAICIIVLVVYMIRMLRMVFHRNDRFRRWFAKNMIF